MATERARTTVAAKEAAAVRKALVLARLAWAVEAFKAMADGRWKMGTNEPEK